jgi:hypothetical protein
MNNEREYHGDESGMSVVNRGHKFYIATKLENHKQHNEVRDMLLKMGHQITYDWTTHGPVWSKGVNEIKRVQQLEFQGVMDADFVVVLSEDGYFPKGRGTHVEIGIAIASGKTIFLVGNPDIIHGAHKDTCCFYHNPLVRSPSNISDLKEYVTIFFGNYNRSEW